MQLDPSVLALSRDQFDLFTTRDALRCGMTAKSLSRAVRARICRSVVRGVFSTHPPPTDGADRLRELTRAMLLTNDHIAATGRSAVAMYHLPLYGVDLCRAQGVWLNENAGRSTRSLIIRRPLVPPAVQRTDGWRVVVPPWALVDLARDAGVVPGVVAMDAALSVGLVDRGAVLAVIDELRSAHRLGRARAMAQLADGSSQSAGESRLRLILHAGGFDLEPQFALIREGGRRAYADFRISGTRVLVEFDGAVKYRGESGAEAVVEEKKREDELRRQGWVLVRVTWADLDRPDRILAWVRQALALVA